MNAPAATSLSLVDGVDVDAVAAAARACPGVEALEGGFPEVATYLTGRRVRGVRVVGDTVEVHIRAAWGIPVNETGAAVRAAVAPLAAGHAVHVTIAGLGDPYGPAPAGAPAVPAGLGARDRYPPIGS
ncbi:hypothetical protein [Catellatospora sp. NPDC049609]|uniref:hypothetical protein n=1 Tax=Catellatospora sp. NPDC049609 TaxID=3155505 RepID=UPI00344A4180